VARKARVLGAVLLTACALLAPAAPSRADISFAPCGDSNDFACGHLTVPLDPSGATPGAITLALRRHRAPVGAARSAIVALAGGPGQAALPFTQQFAELLGAAASTRDLIVFDQRGTGLSHPLNCRFPPALARLRPSTLAARVEGCARQLGGARNFYTSADSVADLEAIRRAGGYDKLVLYGTSYGTKVAELYAQAHPDRVEALVLDSAVLPNGPDPLLRSTFAAVGRVLREVCRERACTAITGDPLGDLARVLARARRAPLHGLLVDRGGRPHASAMYSDELLAALLAGDFSPLLRADLITADRSARAGDYAPLARLLALAGSPEGEEKGFDGPLNLATSCQDQQFAWSRGASPAQRLREQLAAARALPASAFAPFAPANAFDLGSVRECASWPYAGGAPAPAPARMPAVPALILSGASDLRTPTADARSLAAQIPGSQLLVVPDTGHSVLGQSGCAHAALLAFFAGKRIAPCPLEALPPLLRPPPLPPRTLAAVSPAGGDRGLAGRTVHAVALTLQDFSHQLLLALLGSSAGEAGLLSSPTLRAGGLRAGWARFAGGVLTLSGYSYVPGVTVSGSIDGEGRGLLHVGGAAAAHGTLRHDPSHELRGTLGGRHVAMRTAIEAAAGIVVTDARARPQMAVRVAGDGARAAGARAGLRGR
jgi:pimeloyl-ACP methyl ester carboxylesterase